jgi:hypothetical protein
MWQTEWKCVRTDIETETPRLDVRYPLGSLELPTELVEVEMRCDTVTSRLDAGWDENAGNRRLTICCNGEGSSTSRVTIGDT